MNKFIYVLLILFLHPVLWAQNVGIGVDNPQAKLHVAGTILADSLRLPHLADDKKVLTSDIFGNAQWKDFGEALLDSISPVETLLGSEDIPPGVSNVFVEVEGGYMYVIDLSFLYIINVENTQQPELISSYSLGFTSHSFDVQGNLIYIADLDDDVVILNVEDPANPIQFGIINSPLSALEHLEVRGNRLFISSGAGTSRIAAIDISNPLEPEIIYVKTQNGSKTVDIAVHENVVFTANRYNNKTFIEANDANTGNFISHLEISSHFNYYGTLKIEGDRAYFGNPYNYRFDIIDISDVSSMSILGSISTTTTGLGRFGLQGNYLYINTLKEYNVSDPAAPTLSNNFTSLQPGSILNMVVKGTKVYAVFSVAPKIRIIDILQDNSRAVSYQLNGTLGAYTSPWKSKENGLFSIYDRVGIGTQYPQKALDICGDFRVNGHASFQQSIGLNNGIFNLSNSTLRTENTDVDFNNLLFINRNDQVQIGKLLIEGSSDWVSLKDDRPTIHFVREDNNQAITIEYNENEDALKIQDRTDDGSTYVKDLFIVRKNGDILIPQLPYGDRTNLQWDENNGRIYYDNSSLRFKENVTELKEDFSRILQLTPVKYTRKEAPDYWEVGFIAEEAAELGINYLVSYDNEGLPNNFNYEKMIVYLNEIVKQQQGDIATLKEEIITLKGLIQKSLSH